MRLDVETGTFEHILLSAELDEESEVRQRTLR